VVLVGTVDVLIVEVVDVAGVAYLDVSAVLAVFMVVGFGGHVVSDNALVVVPVMGIVQVPVIEVVDVAGGFHRAMPAVRPMDVKIAIRGSSAWFPSSFLILAWHPGVGADHPPPTNGSFVFLTFLRP